MTNGRLFLATCVGLFVAASSAWAHHSFDTEFDANKPVTLRGTLTMVELTNPHGWIYMDVKGSDGKVINWMIELGPPNALIKRGWTKKSVPAGVETLKRLPAAS